MAARNTNTTYGAVTRHLHWLIALLVIALLIVGFFMGDIDSNALKGQVYNLHKLTGLTVFILMASFAVWSFKNTKPAYPSLMKSWEKHLARSVQMLLYILILAMPFTGWIMSTAAGKYPHLFGLNIMMPFVQKSKPFAHFMADIHELLAWTIIALVSLHALGALKHHFIDKNDVLRRMLRGK